VNTRLTIEYDGGAFSGWARQPERRTVQGELERVLGIVRRKPTALTVAGRTDAGVHAWAQVASHAGEAADPRSLNALLPDDVVVKASEQMAEDFDARRDAVARTYCYRIWNHPQRSALLRGRVWWYAHQLDRELLTTAAAAICGEHDFRAFTLSKQPYEHYRRRVHSADWRESDGILEFWITGNTFTRRMVRSLTAFQLEIARGLRHLDELPTLLAGAPRSAGGGTAPACGLYLASVSFGDDRAAGA
jgi:tRNA pseudouridine38-40 synthase